MVKCPKCPECGEPLEVVIPERHGEHYVWNSEKGYYECDDAQIIEQYLCGNCKKPIGGWRGDGESWGFIPEVV